MGGKILRAQNESVSPPSENQGTLQGEAAGCLWHLTFVDFLATEDLANFFLNQLVALLAYFHNFGARNAEFLDVGEDLLRDLGCSLVLGEGVGVVEGVVCSSLLAPPKHANCADDVSKESFAIKSICRNEKEGSIVSQGRRVTLFLTPSLR
jgi:hypothetical protein